MLSVADLIGLYLPLAFQSLRYRRNKQSDIHRLAGITLERDNTESGISHCPQSGPRASQEVQLVRLSFLYRLSQPALALSGGTWAPGHLAQSALSRPFWRIALEFCGCWGRWRTCRPGQRGSRRWRRSTTPSPRSTDRGQYP